MSEYDVIVVGGGAAGLIAAGRAVRLGARVLLLEKMNRPGRKLLITGKGRCNITHDAPAVDYYPHIFPNGRFLKHAFHAFFAPDILGILHERGVQTTTERGKRVFPISNQASDVVDALMQWMGKDGLDLKCGAEVEGLLTADEKVCGVRYKKDGQSRKVYAQNVIVCTGGKSYPATGSTGDGYGLAVSVGHSISPVRPALVPLVTKGDLAGRLQGLGLKNVRAVVWVDGKKSRDAFGELMFAHYGLTGPIVLTLSRHVVEELSVGHAVEVSIDLKPALDEKQLDARLLRDINTHGKKRMENVFKLWLPSKLIPVFLDILGLDADLPTHQLEGRIRKKALHLMKDFRFEVTGHPGFKEAIITAGGVPLGEVESKTMQSKKIKNLYFAGEVLDLDADTGGFNLQIAFSTGWLAAQSAVGKQ